MLLQNTNRLPFCSTGLLVLAGLLVAGGCGGLVPAETDASQSSAGSTTSSSTSGGSASETAAEVTSTTRADSSSGSTANPSTSISGTTGSSSSGDDPDTGISTGFITDPDGGGCGGFSPGVMAHCSLCSYFEDSCVAGEACKPTDNANAGTWTTPVCRPVPDDATGQPGSDCTMEEGPFSGVDTCSTGMCWNVDAETLEGSCVAFCAADVPCANPDEACFEGNGGFVPVCLPRCSPLLQDCPAGQGCYPGTDANFVCIREGDPLYSDAQTLHPQCPTGSFMATEDQIDCPEEGPCCAEFCDLSEPDCVDGFTCAPLFPKGRNPGLQNEGYCASM